MKSIPLTEFYNSGAIVSQSSKNLKVGWGKRTWSSTLPNDSSSCWYAPDFFLHEPYPWFVHEYNAEITIDDFAKLLKSKQKTSKPLWNQPYENVFRESCLDLQNNIRKGSLRKAVPYVVEEASIAMNQELLESMLANVIEYAKRLPVSIYGFWEAGQGIIGASPETLFSIRPDKPKIIETDALAGTTYARLPKQLLIDPKEREEHQIVIDGILSSLAKYGSVHIGETKVVNFAALAHLKTPIQVHLDSSPTFQEIVHALHPTPALGAYPKKEGWSWLLDYQTKIDRRRHGAPFGHVDSQTGAWDCLVAIRNVQWFQNEMLIGAGCGVVAHSNVDNEWTEVQAKISAIKDILGL